MWDSSAAVVTETRAVRQEGETDLQYEHRNWKVSASKKIHDWARNYNFCGTFDSFMADAGLAGRNDRIRSLASLRGEDTAEEFEAWKTRMNRELNYRANDYGYRDSVKPLVEDLGLDPALGLPVERTIEVEVTAKVPIKTLVREGETADAATLINRNVGAVGRQILDGWTPKGKGRTVKWTAKFADA